MLKPETARQLKEIGLAWPDGADVESMVREICIRGWRLMVSVYPKECFLKVYDANYNSAEMHGPAGDFADLVGRALLFVLNMKRGKEK